jgi:sorbitol-specific phosphotransferase system component IIA
MQHMRRGGRCLGLSSIVEAAVPLCLVGSAACGVPEETERIEVPLAAIWIDDTFDDLVVGPLDGQGGWASVPGRDSADVELVDPNKPNAKLVRVEGRGDNPIIMGRDVADQTGCNTLEFDVKISEAAAASVAKIEVQTDPRPGEVGKWANKKFQIYFGTSIRVNYGAGGEAAILVAATEMDRWYHVSASMNVTDEVVSLSVDGSIVTPPLPMGRGPIVSLGLSGWDRSDEDADGGSTGIAFFDDLVGQSIDGCESSGRVWCVRSNAERTGPPCANEFAFRTIQEAINAAASGDEIRIVSGTYNGTGAAVATIGTNLMLTGGYRGSPTGWTNPPASAANSTWVSGQLARRSFEIVGAPVVTIRNLTAAAGGISNAAGTVAVHTFPLEVTGGGSSGGRFSVSSSLDFVGNHTVENGTTILGGGAARILGGTVSVEGTVTARNFEQRGGILTGPGTLTGTHSITWTAGSMTGTGTTVSLLSMTLSGPSTRSHQRTIENRGVLTWRDGGHIAGSGGALFFNAPGALFDIQNDAFYFHSGAAPMPVFSNAGNVRKSAGSGITHLSLVFSGGNVEAQTGTILLDGSGTATGDSHFTVAAGATIDLNGGVPHTYTGSITGAGDGTVRLQSGALTIGSAGANFNLPAPLFKWSGGSLTGPGVLTNSGAVELSAASTKVLTGITIENTGTVTWTGGHVSGSSGATFNNAAGALFDIRNDGFYFHSGAAPMPVFNNAGTIRKSAGADLTHLSVVFSGGNVEAQTGTILLDGSGTATGDSHFTVAAGATIDLNGGVPHTYTGSITGAGDGTVRLQSGTITIGPAGADFALPAPLFKWTGGAFAGTGLLTNSGAMLVSSASTKTLTGITVENTGTVTWTGGHISGSSAATFNNAPGALFDVQSDGFFFHSGAAPMPVFNNAATSTRQPARPRRHSSWTSTTPASCRHRPA